MRIIEEHCGILLLVNNMHTNNVADVRQKLMILIAGASEYQLDEFKTRKVVELFDKGSYEHCVMEIEFIAGGDTMWDERAWDLTEEIESLI